MSSAKYDLTIEQGSDFELPMTFRSGGVLLPLTGHSFKMQIKAFSGEIVWEGTVSNGKIVVNTTNSSVTVRITSTETSAFNFEGASYDLEMTRPDLQVKRILRGYVKLSKEVTV